MLSASSVLAENVAPESTKVDEQNIGNKILKSEYPDAKNILPVVEEETETKVIEGSVEKSIDITLSECIRFALGNNPQIRAAIEEISASDARIKQAWSNYFPKLGWSSSGSKTKNLLFSDAIGAADSVYTLYYLGSISLNQMIYDFGITQNKVTINKLAYKTAQESLTSVVNDVVNQTKNAYYALLLAYDDQKVKEDNVKKYELFYNQAKAFYEIGTNPKVDVTIAEVNLSNAKLQLIQADNQVDIAIANLNNVMGLPYVTKFNVQERLHYSPCEITLDEAMKIAEESRPDLKVAKLKVESARQQLKLTKKQYLPNITFQANYAIGGKNPTSSYGYAFGGYLDFPTVNVMLINNQIKEARANYSKEMANAVNSENMITLEIQKAYITLVEKKNQIPVAFLGMKQAKENYDISFGRYKVGEASPTELKDAQISFLNAQISYYNALYQFNCSRANLEKAIGKNLALGEEVVNLTP